MVACDPLATEGGTHLQLDPPGLQVAFAVQQRDGVERRYQPLEGAGTLVPREQFFDWRSDLGLLLEQLHALRTAARHKARGQRA